MDATILNTINKKEQNNNLFTQNVVSIIGSPLEEGQTLKGVSEACDKLREIGLHEVIKSLGWGVIDKGNISKDNDVNKKINNIIEIENAKEDHITKTSEKKCTIIEKSKNNNDVNSNYYNNIKNTKAIGEFSRLLYHAVSDELKKKNFVLNIGGDHSVAYGSILGSIQVYNDLRVIWIDAHGDINTPDTSPSGNYHGMSLAHVLGLFNKRVPSFEWSESLIHLKPENMATIGIRDIDEYEKLILKKYNINYYTIFDVERDGIYKTIVDALKKIDPYEMHPIHISLDIDGIDNLYAPATGTIAKGGLTYREINYLLKFLADTKRVVSMDLVEYNPSLDEPEKKYHGDISYISENTPKTGKLCLELIARVLGYDIV